MSTDRPTITGCVKLDHKVDAMVNRERASTTCKRIDEILGRLSREYPDMVWIGKSYSIQDLIDALEKLKGDL